MRLSEVADDMPESIAVQPVIVGAASGGPASGPASGPQADAGAGATTWGGGGGRAGVRTAEVVEPGGAAGTVMAAEDAGRTVVGVAETVAGGRVHVRTLDGTAWACFPHELFLVIEPADTVRPPPPRDPLPPRPGSRALCLRPVPQWGGGR